MSEKLEHAGVKGMRWGFRKKKKNQAPVTSSFNKKGGSAPFNPNQFGPGTGYRNYDIKKLNNKELKKVIDRMALEKRYNELNKRPGSATVGSTFTKQFMLELARQNLSSISTTASKHFVQRELNARFPQAQQAAKPAKKS